MKYFYKAKDKNGKLLKSEIEASSEKEVAALIREKGYFPTEISSPKKGGLTKFFIKKVPLKDKIIFTEQLGIMLKSGLPIIEALTALQDETENGYFKGEISKIVFDIQGGTPLSESLSKHPAIFNDIYVNMVKSGEKSGKIEIVLNRLAKQMQKDYELNRKIKGAIAYPAFVLIALIAVMVLIIVFIIPQLKLIFDDAGVELPILTRAIIKLSYIFQKYGWYLLASLAGLVIAFYQLKKTTYGTELLDKIKLKIPVIGLLLKKTYISRFTRTFSSLTASGLPLIEVFKVTSKVVGNVLYRKEIEKMSEKVKAGHSISIAIKECALMPPMIGQLATVGEKSGNVDEVFDTLADFFDRDIDSITSNISTMLEPLLMIVMGVGIGTIIVAVLQPIYGLVNAI